jgi:hypothetical protein
MKSKKTKVTQAILAKKLEVSRQLIAAHIKKGGTPPLNDTEAWRTFLAALGRAGSAPPDIRRKIALERLGILRAQRARFERENQIAAKELMPCGDAIAQADGAMAFFFDHFARWENELPPRLSGLSSIECYKVLHNAIEGLRRDGQARWGGVGK